ncbi:MAG TPA: DUF6596 domain-containing protein, partial [Planctomycetia bacterium]|nr:DUF6596 domain-containing protein [Planctomycetia bacterium]
DPAGWLFRVAKNLAADALRRERTFDANVAPAAASSVAEEAEVDRVHFADEIADDRLRMLFVCCHPAVPPESQVALALKTLCGMSVREIARALLATEANVQKRIARAKEKLRSEELDVAFTRDLFSRTEAVRTTLYLLFNEGYCSTQADRLVRADLCDEAIRLALLLASSSAGDEPPTAALVALMHFHAARFAAREDEAGRMLLLEHQDRGLWDQAKIGAGLAWLSRSARGDELSRFHLEAGIAAEHCLAATFGATDWPRILMQYDLLVKVAPTPIHRLNRAIALAHVDGPAAGLAAIRAVADAPAAYHLWEAALGELESRAGNVRAARAHFSRARELAPTHSEQALLDRKIAELPKS